MVSECVEWLWYRQEHREADLVRVDTFQQLIPRLVSACYDVKWYQRYKDKYERSSDSRYTVQHTQQRHERRLIFTKSLS